MITRYTSTEAGVCTSTLVDDDAEVVATTVGRPAPEVESRIVDPDDGTGQSTGEVGEVRCRSAAMIRGYWRDPKRTTKPSTPTAGCTPATSASWVPTATFASSDA